MDTAIGGVGQGGADVTSHYGETPEQAADSVPNTTGSFRNYIVFLFEKEIEKTIVCFESVHVRPLQ